MNLTWVCKRFNELSADEMYTVLCVRQEVFVLEQECLYLDADGKDRNSFHLIGYKNNEVVVMSVARTPCAAARRVKTKTTRRFTTSPRGRNKRR